MTGLELSPSDPNHGYRVDPMTGNVIRDAGYNLNYFIPVGGGDGLDSGQVAQYRPLNFEIDKMINDKLLISVAPDGYLKRV